MIDKEIKILHSVFPSVSSESAPALTTTKILYIHHLEYRKYFLYGAIAQSGHCTVHKIVCRILIFKIYYAN